MENVDVNKSLSLKRDRDGSGELVMGLTEARRIRNKTGSHSSSRLLRVNSDEPEVYLHQSTRVPVDILDILDEDDVETQELETFMKSFEEEILKPLPPQEDSKLSTVSLGYLLGASDDELGLPPAVSPGIEQLIPQIETKPSYDSLALNFDDKDFVFEREFRNNFDDDFGFEKDLNNNFDDDFRFDNESDDFSEFCFRS